MSFGQMESSRSVWDVGGAVRKLSSRFRRPTRVSRTEWPAISTIRPLFYAIRLFGLTPFEISEDHANPGTRSMIYSYFCALAHTYLIYEVVKRFITVERNTTVLNYTENFKVILNYCIVMTNIIVSATTVKKFIRVIDALRHFDSRMRDLGQPREEGINKFGSWLALVGVILLWISVNQTGIMAFAEPFFANFKYLINYTASSMCVVKFSGTVLMLGQRFKHLNRVARVSKSPSNARERSTAVDIRTIQRLHNGLMNASESLNSQYSWCLLLWLINLCIHSVSNLYFLIDWLMITPEWVTTKWSLVNCITLWLVIFVGQLLLIHVACHFASAEANGIGGIIVEWQPSTIDRNERVETALHLINRRLNFSAAGCFHVNLPLLRSISALMTTYLVLLLQFQT